MIRTLIKVELSINDRWAVGTWTESDATVQMQMLADPRKDGRPYLPATGLAGSLRRHLSQKIGEDATIAWMGAEPGDYGTRTGAVQSVPGKLMMLGCLPIESAIQERGMTSIDLDRGAAKAGPSRTEQWAEPTTVTLVSHHEGPRNVRLLEAMVSWEPIVGRSQTTGLGRANVTEVTSIEIDLANSRSLHWWLGYRDNWLRNGGEPPKGVSEDVRKRNHREQKPDWFVRKLVVEEPIHIGVVDLPETQDDGHRAAPTMRSSDELVVPGSSWKGVFRNRSSVILVAVGASTEDREAILDHLFGNERQRGVLEFRDSLIKNVEEQLRTHVAIDRFTGGARDSALFRTKAIPVGSHLSLQVNKRSSRPYGAFSNLLDHVLNDLHDGLITLGGHGTRGYGHIQRRTRKVPALKPVDVNELLRAVGHGTEKTHTGGND